MEIKLSFKFLQRSVEGTLCHYYATFDAYIKLSAAWRLITGLTYGMNLCVLLFLSFENNKLVIVSVQALLIVISQHIAFLYSERKIRPNVPQL